MSFWEHVKKVLQKADIIIIVLDARMIEETRHPEIETKIQRLGKKMLYVVNKADLADVEKLKSVRKQLIPSVFVSSTEKLGTTILLKKILELSHGESVTVGVVGYPNVGKSSLINALAGRGAARTSAASGFTRGIQRIRVGSKIILLDTPGVFPQREKDDLKHGKTGAVDYSKIRDAEWVVLRLIGEKKELICDYYSVFGDDSEDILCKIAIKFKKLRKKGEPDLETAARLILKDWQKGKIKG